MSGSFWASRRVEQSFPVISGIRKRTCPLFRSFLERAPRRLTPGVTMDDKRPMLLKNLIRAIRAPAAPGLAARTQYPLEVEAKLNRLHARAPVRRYLDILH